MSEHVTSEESLNRFLTTITAELGSLKKITALYAPKLAPGFNAVDCLYPDENRLSAVIAMLLDPNGGHGQGATFLKLFLDLLEETIQVQDNLKKISEMSEVKLQESCSKIGLEVPTTLIKDSQRRIDILLQFNTAVSNGFGLAIENKPWAIDQPKQIEAYDEYLTNRYSTDNYLLIYLSGNGQPPSEDSVNNETREKMESSGRFIITSYFQLKEWCQLCIEKCQAPRLRYFLEDFESYIRDKFEGGIPIMEEEVVIKNALKPENIGAVVAVGFAWPEIASKFISNLINLVFDQLCIEGMIDKNKWETYEDFVLTSKYSKFGIKQKIWKKYYYTLEFGEINARDFYFGIKKQSLEAPTLHSDVIDRIDKSNLGIGERSDWWPWVKNFDVPYLDWSKSDKPWVGIKEGGDTVKEIAEKLKMLVNICTEEINKLESELAKDLVAGA